MTAAAPDHPLQPGDAAPSFHLPAVNRTGTVSLDDYRGKSAVMIGLFRGLHCPFCRRQIVQLAMAQDKLAQQSVATVAIVNSQLERARLYFQYRPIRMELAVDPEVQTRRAFGVPSVTILPDHTDPRELQWPKTTTMAQLMTGLINPSGELPEKMNFVAAMKLLNQQDGFKVTEADKQISAVHWTQLDGHFLIDASGVIRWSSIEARETPDQLGSLPGEKRDDRGGAAVDTIDCTAGSGFMSVPPAHDAATQPEMAMYLLSRRLGSYLTM